MSTKNILKISLICSCFLGILALGSGNVSAKTKEVTVEGTRVKYIKQDIDGKEQVIGCNLKGCSMHSKKKKYGDKGCKSGSDLRNIHVEITNKKKTSWKTLEDLKFTSMQGGCIEGDKMYLSFSDKGKNKKGDLTALVIINLKESKVMKVVLIKGAAELNIDTLGHSNDLTILNNNIHVSWYQEEGKKYYTNKMGIIKKDLSNTGNVSEVGKKGKSENLSAFGVSVYSKSKKKLALAFRHESKKEKNIKRYIDIYQVKAKKNKYKYKKVKRLFTIPSNKKYNITQCMEYYNKKFYIVRYNKKSGNVNNNCIEKRSKNGKLLKLYKIKDPNKIEISAKESNTNKDITVTKKMKKLVWEIECLAHYKKNTFFYTQYKPASENGKQAFLYKIKLK